MEDKLEQLNETMQDILKVLVGILVSLEKKRDEKLSEEDILFPYLEELQGSRIQVCAICAHFDPKTKVCERDDSRFEQDCEHLFHCPMFNRSPER